MITYTCRYSSGYLIPIIQSCQCELGIKWALEYLQVILVSLLFLTMIPIDCKITNFPYAKDYSFLAVVSVHGHAQSLHQEVNSCSFYFT